MAQMLLSEAAVGNVAAYVSSLEPVVGVSDGLGDPTAGAGTWAMCLGCHGANGEGSEALNAPRLDILPDWYVVRQIDSFKAGTRGSEEGDMFGAQMKGMATALATDEIVRDVAAYIASLSQ